MRQFIYKHSLELVIFLASLSVYVVTSSRSIVQGDTGEFLAAAATGGVPHEPGYPLYSILSRIVYVVPLGHPAWQVNVLSAIFASLALVFTFKIVRTLTQSTPSALFSVLALGTYESFWFYALVAEVHTLQVFLLSLLFYCLFSAVRTKKSAYLYFAAFVFGLGISNNTTIVFTAPSFIIALVTMRKQLTLSNFIKLALCSSLGLVPYLYTLYASAFNASPVSWGELHDVSSFLQFALRANYGTLGWAISPTWYPFKYSTSVYFFTSIFKTSWYILPFFVASLFLLRKHGRPFTMLLSSFILFGPVFYWLLNAEVPLVVQQANAAQYLAYPFLFISILSGLGLSEIFKRINAKNSVLYPFLVGLFFIPALMFNLPRIRLDNNNLTQRLTKVQLSEVSKNGTLLLWGDGLYDPAIYWQYVEKYRPDITIIQMGMFDAPWYREQLGKQHPEISALLNSSKFDYIRACELFAGNDKLYILPWYPEIEASFQNKCKIIPYGLINKVVPSTRLVNLSKIKQFSDKELNNFASNIEVASYKNHYLRTRETLFYLAEQLGQTGQFYSHEHRDDWAIQQFRLARETSFDEPYAAANLATILRNNGDRINAIEILKDSIDNNPAIPILYKQLGQAYYEVNQQENAYKSLKEYLDFQPNDKDVPQIDNFIWSYENSKLLH